MDEPIEGQPRPGESPEPGWRPYRSVAFLWKVVVVLLGIATAIDAIAVMSDRSELQLLDRIARGEQVTLAEADANDARQRALGLLQSAALIVTGVPFIVWTNRAYSNIRTLGAQGLRFRRWWTIGGWFVPIWLTFRPKQIVNDIWRASDPGLPARVGPVWQEGRVPWWWTLWWLAFLFSNVAFNYAARVWLGEPQTLMEIRSASTAYLVGDTLSVVAGVLAILVVRGASLRQLERARRLGAEPGLQT